MDGRFNLIIVSLLVFFLQGFLHVLHWAWEVWGGEGAWWIQGLELLFHVNILKLLLLSDGCHLLNLFLSCLQTLPLKVKMRHYKC